MSTHPIYHHRSQKASAFFHLFSYENLVLSTGVAQADDKEDVIAAVDAVLAAWAAGDVDAIQKFLCV